MYPPFHHLLLLLLLFVVHGTTGIPTWNYTSSGRVSMQELERIQQYLAKVNKPAVKTIQSVEGDVVDCVPIHKQLAFDHPALKNHKLQVAPSMPKSLERREKNYGVSENRVFAAWPPAPGCPKGTVPIRRITVDDVLRAGSLYRFIGKEANQVGKLEHAVAVYNATPGNIHGGSATLNVWNPVVEGDNEFSASQIWISGGKAGQRYETVRAGWQVYPQMYGDYRTRIFSHWTIDGSQSTGCYDVLCSGFVQVSRNIFPGMIISNISVYDGDQLIFEMGIWKAKKTGDWWMGYEKEPIGYWPHELFQYLNSSADLIKWGGEIANNNPNNRHTTTQMGSGSFADEGWGKASFFNSLKIFDLNNFIPITPFPYTQTENNNCYNIIVDKKDEVWGTFFYYGGDGLNKNCS
ncbi:protein neprosin-like [Curcuma longa]|uniref:protein neprosin-like n=1 Tax=Curcuma longa TaxID=136217 RepID=UPI003D9EA496